MSIPPHNEHSQTPPTFYATWDHGSLPKSLTNAHQTQVKHLFSNLDERTSLDVAIASSDRHHKSTAGDTDNTISRGAFRSAQLTLTRHLAPYRTDVTPLAALPDDVLLIIFALCFPSPLTVPLPRAFASATHPIPLAWQTTAPWNLLAVCTRWRRLVLGAPTLWANLEVNFGRTSQFARRASFFDVLLARSGESTPIKLEIRAERTEAEAAARILSEMILTRASRLKELELALPADVLDTFLALPPSLIGFDQLESVVVEYPDHTMEKSVNVRRVFSNAPSLRRFTIHGRVSATSLELPWDQLLELHLERTFSTAEDCHRILQRCPQLISCTITFFEATHSPAHPPDPHQPFLPTATLPNLTRFVLDGSPLSPFLTRLRLPALTSLTLHTDIDRTSCDTALLPFLARCPCLTHLTLTWWVPSDTIKTLLRAVPRLTHLHFVPGKTAEVFKLLWAVDLAPRLERLTFVCYPVIWEEVVEIIGLRGLVGRLREVRIETFYRQDVEVWERDPRIGTLREMGMRLELANMVEGR
ncbi:hypothetical protein LshimejAT787_0703210 [Lyophyllum shimeji]|uniref:F-box domain-containing protein n=1 Tax=Lyophyllum shimeji TaxID=47721 RepID=A0A9P3PR34_LYOSH|nr:hypothetical protein LshimejAT787_0703210 [Lyophyllum shimeji]